MTSSVQLANRFREVILDGTWIANTNYKDQLEGLGWRMVTSRVKSLNTMALLAQHVHYYISGIKKVLQGGSLDIKDTYSFDFAPIESQEQWEDFLNIFWRDAEEFAGLIEQVTDEKLQEVFVDERYGSYERNLEAMIEHSYYHLGQIVLIKKLLLYP